MKYIFFLFSLLFIPITVYADDTYRGETYQVVTSDQIINGTVMSKWTGGLTPYIATGDVDSQGRDVFAPYLYSETTNSQIIESNGVSWKLNKNTCTIQVYNDNITVSSIPVIGDVSYTLQEKIDGVWTNSVHNGMECNITIDQIGETIQVVTKQGNESIGYKEIEYLQKNGELEVFLKSPIDTFGGKIYGFAESQIKMQDISINGTNYNVASENIQLVPDDLKIIDGNQTLDMPIISESENGVIIFDTKDEIHDALTDMKIQEYNNNLQIVYDYHDTDPLEKNTRLEIDPTFSATPTNENSLEASDVTPTTCNGKDYTGLYGNNRLVYDASICRIPYFSYDISSIPSNVIVSSATWTYDSVTTADIPADGCKLFDAVTNPTGSQANYDSVFSATAISNAFTSCTTIQDNNNVSINSGGITKIQENISASDGYYAFYFFFVTEPISTKQVWIRQADANLQITYAMPINTVVSNLACTGQPYSYSCTFNTTNATGTTGYYIQTSSNNSTWSFTNQTLIGNVTSGNTNSIYGVNDLNYIRVNATNNNASNGTASNHVLVSTDGYPDAPSIVATPASATQIDVVRTAGASNGGDVVDDYSLRASINGADWTTLVSNSTIANFYNHTGISWASGEIVYQWRDGNDVGWSNYSANATAIISPPNTYSTLSPTNLVVYPVSGDGSKLNLEWVASGMNNINGYRIQRESPVGGGFSTIVSNTTNANTYYNNTGLSVNTYYNYRVYAMNGSGISGASNTYSQTTFHLPDPVDDLTVTPSDILSFDLDWSQPDILYGYLLGYNINYTTPLGEPTTVYVANTGSSNTSYEVTGTEGGSEYSFRVSAITIHGKNVEGGNIANGTAFNAFEIGTLDISTEGTDQRPIVFSVYPIDDDTSDVVVTYDPSLQLACDFKTTFTNGNTTYTGLDENVNGELVYSNFTVNGINSDIIDIDCWDELDTTVRGQERIGQAVIPMVQQVNNFQDGMFNTDGNFGAFDMMTIIIIIISMIGFNRSHPYVGVIVMGAVIGFARYYGFIGDFTVATGLIILVVVLAIAYGRRDNEA